MNFIYKDLSNSVERELAVILGKITHHIHPDVVSLITEANITYKNKFSEICHKKCDVSSFFYKNSDCVFPGFRRPINKEKVNSWKNNINQSDGTILNDNTYPRHLWAYLSMNKAYSGGINGMWVKSGLNQFELAHIFSHKQDERELEKEVFPNFDNDIQPYGLFTSASNVVLIPKGFSKPTDQMKNIKICFFKRHLDLYGNNMIGISDFDERQLPSWYEDVKWLSPDLPINWENKIHSLLKYREKHLASKYA